MFDRYPSLDSAEAAEWTRRIRYPPAISGYLFRMGTPVIGEIRTPGALSHALDFPALELEPAHERRHIEIAFGVLAGFGKERRYRLGHGLFDLHAVSSVGCVIARQRRACRLVGNFGKLGT